MIKIKNFVVNPFQMNCYIYYDDLTHAGIIIDPAAYSSEEQSEIEDFVSANKIKMLNIFNTHGHIDHVLGNKWAKEFFNVPIIIHENDLNLLSKASEHGEMFGISVPLLPNPDKLISNDEVIDLNFCEVKIVNTPGHSPGSICLVDEENKNIFVGDCIFKNSIGRTDLPGGDLDILLDSINNKILIYPDDFVIYPGHMEYTIIGAEKKNNPFLNGKYNI